MDLNEDQKRPGDFCIGCKLKVNTSFFSKRKGKVFEFQDGYACTDCARLIVKYERARMLKEIEEAE